MTVVCLAVAVAAAGVMAGDAGAVTVISASESPTFSETGGGITAGTINSVDDMEINVTIMVCKIRRVGIIIQVSGLLCFPKYIILKYKNK